MLSNLTETKLHLYKTLLFPVFVSNIEEPEVFFLVLIFIKLILSFHLRLPSLGTNIGGPPSGFTEGRKINQKCFGRKDS